MVRTGQLIQSLCDSQRMNRGVLVGNGTTGIYLILKALGFSGKKIALPNNVCPNIPLAVLFSGNVPVYLEISRQDLGLSLEALNRCADIHAVVAVHSHGSVGDIEGIKKLCSEKNWFLIEDFCVAQGARKGSSPVGSFGDASVVSFGSGKIINVGHGGAVFSNELDLIENVSELAEKLPYRSELAEAEIDSLSKYHTKLYNDHYGNNVNAFASEFRQRSLNLKKSFLVKFCAEYEENILSGLKSLEKLISRREENAQKFLHFFSHSKVSFVEPFLPPEGSVYWRFNVFIKKNRDDLLKMLLREKCKISSWFPPVNLFLEDNADLSDMSDSEMVGKTILNLWVNEEIDDIYIKTLATKIVAFFDEERDGK